MKVPLLDLKAQLSVLREEILESVTNVIDSTRYVQGPEVEALENEIATYCNARFGIGVSSGTDALIISLMSLGIVPGDKVVTTPYSFFATMGAILRVGAIPIFADIDPISYNIDPSQIELLLDEDKNREIKALIPVHLYGQCADMEKINTIAQKYDVAVIEDAAQAIGAEVPFKDAAGGWARAGSIGTCGCFSFFPSKNLGGIGDGGMVVTQSQEFGQKTTLLRNHGAKPKYYHALVGGNFRLDPIQATVLRLKLKHLESWHRGRRKNAQFYTSCFNDLNLEGSSVVTPKAVFKEIAQEETEVRNDHIYNQYILRVRDRDRLRAWLTKKEIGTEIYYPVPLHRQQCVSHLPPQKNSLKHAEQAAEETIALPIYPELTEDMLAFVVNSIAEFYR